MVARLTMPFISISAKKLTLKSKACITNQYFAVSSSQISTEVKNTIRMLHGERREASPSRNLCMMPLVCSRKRAGTSRSMNHCPMADVRAGNMAASRKTTSAPMKASEPHSATLWMLPTNPELPVSLASSDRLTNTNPSMTTPSKMRSTMMVASEAETGTPSRRLRITARSTSPARAG